MKIKSAIFVLLVLSLSGIYAQRLTTGILSGSNFSNIRGNNQSGEWKNKMGSVSGVWFDYAFSPVLSVGTEFNYTSLYYQHLDYQTYYPYPTYLDYSTIAPTQYYYPQSWNFNFFRFPLYFKLSTPTKLRFELSAGMYFSLLQLPTPTYYSDKDYPTSEFGKIFSVGLTYPITDKIEIFAKGRYISGNREYISYNNGKNASSELIFGVGYSGLFNKMKFLKKTNYSLCDSSDCKISISYRVGANLSWIETDKGSGSYKPKVGLTSGVVVNYSINENTGIQTELLLEKRGFQLNDSTSSHYRFIANSNNQNSKYYTNSTIETTYFTIPLLFELKFSDPFRVHVNTGPYYSTLINAKATGNLITENKIDNYYNKTKTTINDNIDGVIAPDDWGWIIGGGIQIPLIYNWKLDIEARYQTSWSNFLVLPPSNSSMTDNKSTQYMSNRSFTLLFGLNIPIY